MENNKRLTNILIIVLVIIILVFVICFLFKKSSREYDIGKPFSNYNLERYRDDYLESIKAHIQPPKLRTFIDNDYITFSQYKESATGNAIKNQMIFKGYKMLFTSLFDKERTNFDDCPVTNSFKEKYNTNLLYYYGLNASDDCDIICSLDYDEKTIVIEVYGDLKNTEPTYWKTHHFHYTLDSEGNVDDVIFDYTE